MALIAVDSSVVNFAQSCEESGLTFSQESHWPIMLSLYTPLDGTLSR